MSPPTTTIIIITVNIDYNNLCNTLSGTTISKCIYLSKLGHSIHYNRNKISNLLTPNFSNKYIEPFPMYSKEITPEFFLFSLSNIFQCIIERL